VTGTIHALPHPLLVAREDPDVGEDALLLQDPRCLSALDPVVAGAGVGVRTKHFLLWTLKTELVAYL